MATNISVPTAALREYTKTAPCPYTETQLKQAGRRAKVELDFTKVSRQLLKSISDNAPEDTVLKQIYSIRASMEKAKKTGDVLFSSIEELKSSLSAAIGGSMSPDKLGYIYKTGQFGSLEQYLVTAMHSNDKENRYGYRSNSSRPSAHYLDISAVAYRYNDAEDCARQIRLRINPESLISFLEKNEIAHERAERSYTYDGVSYTVTVDVKISVPVSWRDYVSFQYENVFMHGTEELKAEFDKQFEKFRKAIKGFGRQVLLRGSGERLYEGSRRARRYYSYASASSGLTYDGSPGRGVINSIPSAINQVLCGGEESESNEDSLSSKLGMDDMPLHCSIPEVRSAMESFDLIDCTHRVTTHNINGVDANTKFDAPLIPGLSIFHLQTNANYFVHISCIRPYKYNEDVLEKVILPKKTKYIVKLLASSAESTSLDSDVISGKGASTIITFRGRPGLGKTLLAEAMAETCNIPLYKVEADVLGTTSDSVEEGLSRVLYIAQRFGAMVMIDEANAYVHERDTNHEQTAIVGVFLRKLEYFRGVLFLATNQTKANQQFDIDEAILSRCVAVIDFDMPTPAEAAQIWIVQCRQQGIAVSKETVRELAQKYNLSGRSIRNVLRLTRAHILLKNDGDETVPLAVEDVDFCYDVSARLKHEGLRTT